MPLLDAAPGLPVVTPTGWMAPAYVWMADDERAVDHQDGFGVRGRLGVEATMPTVPVRARLEVELLPEPVMKDAWLQVAPTSYLTVQAGQFKVPFSVHQLSSDTRRALPDGPRVVSDAKLDREVGAAVTLALPVAGQARAAFTSGVFNGEGPNRIRNVNQRYAFAQRLLITPLGARPSVFEGTARAPYLGVGGGWLYDYEGDVETAQESNGYGAELQAAYGLLSVQGEWMLVEYVHANPTVADYEATGLYAQAGCFLPAPWARDHLELVGRYERSDPDTAFGSTEDTSFEEFQAVEVVSVGLNAYVWTEAPRFHDLKVQVAFAHPSALEGLDGKDDRFTVQGVARF